HIFAPVALQRAQVVGVAQLGAQLFEDRPVPVPPCGAELALEMVSEIILHAVVVEQRVVHVQQEHHLVCRCHSTTASGAGSCHWPPPMMIPSALDGPRYS